MQEVDLHRGRWSPSTIKLYDLFWRSFAAYCKEHDKRALPAKPKTIADFLTANADGHSTSWLSGALAAITQVHALYGHNINVKGSVIRDTWSEIRRQKGTKGKPKAALATEDIKKIIRAIPATRMQDRAVLLLGFASAMRRSEIVALNVADLAADDESLTITILRSKTDKSGKGEVIAIRRSGTEFCPVAALLAWLSHAEITEGAIFRSRSGARMVPRKVADIAKFWAKRAGYASAEIGAHSLRRGCITSMFYAGADLRSVMNHSRHRTSDIALGYVQAQRAAQNPAIKLLGL